MDNRSPRSVTNRLFGVACAMLDTGSTPDLSFKKHVHTRRRVDEVAHSPFLSCRTNDRFAQDCARKRPARFPPVSAGCVGYGSRTHAVVQPARTDQGEVGLGQALDRLPV